MVCEFADFDQITRDRYSGYPHTALLEAIDVLGVNFVTVAVALTDLILVVGAVGD